VRGASRGWGGLALAFYAVHAGRHLALGHPADALWACHLGAVLVGLGWLLGAPRVNAIGFFWLAMGTVLWGIDLAAGGEFIATSLLTHLGGLVLGALGLVRLGMPRGAWLSAIAAFLALQVLCRFATPPELNVNLSHVVPSGWETRFPSYAGYQAMLLAIGALAFWCVERMTRALLLRTAGAAGSCDTGGSA
jgi:hypothetical protein